MLAGENCYFSSLAQLRGELLEVLVTEIRQSIRYVCEIGIAFELLDKEISSDELSERHGHRALRSM